MSPTRTVATAGLVVSSWFASPVAVDVAVAVPAVRSAVSPAIASIQRFCSVTVLVTAVFVNVHCTPFAEAGHAGTAIDPAVPVLSATAEPTQESVDE